MSKSISGFGLPIAIVLIKPEYDQWKPAEHNGTFRSNNHAFVTATEALEHYWRTEEFADSIAAKGKVLESRLQKIMNQHRDHVVEVRGRGMMRGLRCRDPKQAAAITAHAFNNGAIFERAGSHDEVIRFLMPLTIETCYLNKGLDILEHAFETIINPVSCGNVLGAATTGPTDSVARNTTVSNKSDVVEND